MSSHEATVDDLVARLMYAQHDLELAEQDMLDHDGSELDAVVRAETAKAKIKALQTILAERAPGVFA